MKLVLFDIDGTIMEGHGSGRAAFDRTMKEYFPEGYVSLQQHEVSGQTDGQILIDTIKKNKFPQKCDSQFIKKFYDTHEKHIREELAKKNPFALPGVKELIIALSKRKDVALGLLTGNMVSRSKAKLESVGLASYFDFRIGGFGDDSTDRNELANIAVKRANELLNADFKGKEIVVIGDTHRDAACAKVIGARMIGVTHSKNSHGLHKDNTDHLFAHFRDTNAVIEVILK